jgi:magnesium-transporting ATPase (P-type)
MLFAAAAVSAALQSWPDMGLILGVVVVNVAVGMFQEGKAEKVCTVMSYNTAFAWLMSRALVQLTTPHGT